MGTPADTFRRNLQEAAKTMGLDKDSLAVKCGFRGADRKWLDRCWSAGLNRPDARTQKKLNKLCELLGLKDSSCFWDEGFRPTPAAAVSHKDKWLQLVSDVLWKHQLYQHAKLRQGSVVRAASKAYGHNEALFIADWLAYERGMERMTDADLDMIIETLGELRDELLYNFQTHGSIVGYVRERAMEHPNWEKFEAEATDMEQCSTDEERRATFDEKLVDIVQGLQHRTLTPPEVYEQFVRIYLEGKDAPVQVEYSIVKKILGTLREHEEWRTYVKDHHDGSEKRAEDHVARLWRQTAELFGPTVRPGTFTDFFERAFIDPSDENHLDEPSAKTHRPEQWNRRDRRRKGRTPGSREG